MIRICALLLIVVATGCTTARHVPEAADVWTAAERAPQPAAKETAPEPERWLAAEDGPTTTHSKHRANVLAGYATGRDAFTLGFQYENRMRDKWGVGALADVAFGSDSGVVLAAAFYYHPMPKLTVLGAPGYSFVEDDFLVRLGASYDFEWKDFKIGPAAYVDVGARGTPVLLAAFLGKDF